MSILCLGIGVSFRLIYRLSDAHGLDLLAFVVCLLSTMKEYRDVIVNLFARGEITRGEAKFHLLHHPSVLGDGLDQGPCEIRAAAFGEHASSHLGGEGADS